MKLEKLIIANETGETGELSRADYIKHIVKTQEVKPYTNEETGETPADKVVLHILKAKEGGTDVDPAIEGEYSELVALIEADVARTSGAKADKAKQKEEEKAKKEKEKKEREEAEAAKKAELALTQSVFAEKVAIGANLAEQEFAEEMKALKDSLPDGAKVVAHGSGYGIEFASDATKETIGQALGYLMQKADNSSFVGNQLHFWVGDTIGVAVARGIYATAKEAAGSIAKLLSEKSGKTIEAPSLDQYKRMAERTPVEFRNPKADPTAYLALSSMKAPRKDEAGKETDENYKKRLEAFEADRAAVQKQLAVGELTKRKEVMPLVNELLVKHGMRQAADPNAPVISLSQNLQIVFHASFALENLLGAHKENIVIYKDGDKLVEVTKKELEDLKEQAMGNLMNALYTNEKLSLKPADYIRGFVNKETEIEVAKDANKKPIMEKQTIKMPVYPVPFFEKPTEEKPEEAPVAAEEAPKKAKK